MNFDFNSLKNKTDSLAEAQAAAEKLKTKYANDEENIWTPTLDAAGNGFAIFRFLPAPFVDGPDTPHFVRFYRHSFQGPLSQEWYIENCLTTLNKKDPCNDLVRILYKSGTEHDKKLAGLYKRKTTYVTNIYMIDDRGNPANNGKIFKYKFGTQVWNQIDEVMFPKIGTAINPFDLWKGANFALVVKRVDKWPNYNSSKFDTPAPLNSDDNVLKDIWEREFSIKEYIDEKNYKTYDELKAKLDSVLSYTWEERGTAGSSGPVAATTQKATASAPIERQAAMKPVETAAVTNNKTINEVLEGDSIPYLFARVLK